MINYRRLNHNDYEDILDISKDIWNGTDYLPNFFHKWIDATGFFMGAEDTEKNKVVAVGKFSILPDKSGWFEGLRVHKDYRGQKIARGLSESLLAIADKELRKGNIKKISFATYATNIESVSLMEKLNFKLENESLILSKKHESLNPNTALSGFTVEEWDLSYDDFIHLPYIKKRNNFFSLGFVFQEPTLELYNELKAAKTFIKINGHPGMLKLKGEVHFLAVNETVDAISTFMDYCLVKYKDKFKPTPITSVLPQDVELIKQLKEAGFITLRNVEPDYLLYVYR